MAKNVLRRIASWGDGWLPNRVTPTQIEESRRTLDTLAAEAGRDPASLNISVFGQPVDGDLARSFLNAGADRVIITPPTQSTDEAMAAELERIAELVLR